MFTALRKEERAAYRRRLHALLGIPEGATELQMHQLIVAGFLCVGQPEGQWYGLLGREPDPRSRGGWRHLDGHPPHEETTHTRHES